jgi:hemerythrin-like domain-containing protein
MRDHKEMIQIGAPAATLDHPVEHLTACHRRIEQRLDTLMAAAGHLENDRERALEAIAKSIRFLDSSGVTHTEDEEASLFPRLRPKLSPDEMQFIDSLEQQHEQADAIYSELKELVKQAGAQPKAAVDLVNRYRDCAGRLASLYREHIRTEDEILTRLAKRSLTDSDLTAISAEMKARRAK